VKGLYVAGDESISGISQAAVSGWIAGENAAKYSKEVSPPTIERTKAKIKEKKDLINQIRSREIGPNWKEVNIALQQIMMDYAGTVRSETLLEAGLSYLLRLKKKACSTMKAVNQHEMARCLEVLNLLDLGELIFITAIERKETRGPHVRTDCPFTNPLLNNKLLFIKKVDEKPLTGWKEVK
jgi:succinate dehydrogenase/fumarate reductase flavoprotein subunit